MRSLNSMVLMKRDVEYDAVMYPTPGLSDGDEEMEDVLYERSERGGGGGGGGEERYECDAVRCSRFVLSDTDEKNVRCDAMMQSKSVVYLLVSVDVRSRCAGSSDVGSM